MKKCIEDFWAGFTTVIKDIFGTICWPSCENLGIASACTFLAILLILAIFGIAYGVEWVSTLVS